MRREQRIANRKSSPLFTTHYSLLTTHYSLLTTPYPLLATHYSLFPPSLPAAIASIRLNAVLSVSSAPFGASPTTTAPPRLTTPPCSIRLSMKPSARPGGMNHPAEKDPRQINMLEHVPTAKPLHTLAGHALSLRSGCDRAHVACPRRRRTTHR